MASSPADGSRRTHRTFNQVLWRVGRIGVSRQEYAKTGRLKPRDVPSILSQAFITLWSGAAVGPEGPLVFLTGGVGTFLSDRLRLQKDDVQVLVYSSIAEPSEVSLANQSSEL
jgi:hypothetical protein